MSTAYLPAANTESEHFVLRGATLIDGNGGDPVTEAEIEVKDGRIVHVGPQRTASATSAMEGVPAGDGASTGDGTTGEGPRVVDLRGKTVMPGFIDSHVHFGLSVENQAANLARFASERIVRSAVNARNTLMAGATTARDLGGTDRGVRDSIEQGLILGPRIHLAISPLSPTGGHTDFTMPNGLATMPPMPVDPIIDTDDDVRRTVRTLIRSGADVIKVCTTGGVSSPSDTPDDIGVPEEHVRLIVEEADKRAHQPVAAHAQGAEGIKAAIRGGVRSVEHGYGIDDEGIELMLGHGTFLVPTLSSALRVPDPRDVPGYLYEKKVKWSAIARERVAVATSAGVKVALGTDSGVCPHGVNLREAMHAVELGLTPMQAIVSGTRNAAELLRLSGDLGTLEEGKLADLLVVDFDPLADITALAEPDNVKAVVQGGHLVKDSAGWFQTAILGSALG
ncbi:metal-dependent hydrolase family protein [Brevibacterium marinum]|uniref:Imidazolonepropionase-like amidohydrolase n=1 Tax=Brevibacterium marinum TaxID=418643 RepID=A0A846SB54_9MICO|nr:amidohydrolase family protein [Brevibacterium marinum]NJC57997.1 imidazolonepropionase-like amidohydrolase [Brevibacterium marinum]